MRVAAAALLFVSSAAFAQPARVPDREPLRAQLIAQAREARARQDYGACTSYLDAATAIRADTLVRYAAALCAMQGGLLPEARRLAHACLHETEGDPEHLRNCQRLIGELDALEAPPAPQPPRSAPPPTASPRHAATAPTARPSEARGVPAGAVVLWASGGVSLALAGVSLALHGDAAGGCVAQGSAALCPDAASAARAVDAGTWAAVANTSFVVGIAALAGGTVWWLVDRARGRGETVPAVRAVVGLGAVGIAGTF